MRWWQLQGGQQPLQQGMQVHRLRAGQVVGRAQLRRLGGAQLLTGGDVGQNSDDLTRGLHADGGNQQLLFQRFKQISVNFLTSEQADKSGTEVFFGF